MNLSEDKKVKSLFNYLFLFIIIGFGIYWRVHVYLSNIPLWWDEISLALSFFDRDIFGMFAYLECDQKAPPLFCVLVWIIKHFFANEQTSYALRLLPLLASIGSLFAFYFLLKDFYKSKFAILMSM